MEEHFNTPGEAASAFAGLGTIAAQPHFAPVRRRDLMAAVNTLGRKLGLKPASVVVLDALLGCLPCHDARTKAEAPITPLMLLTVYAANETLCFRAKGMTERQLRRHLERLEALGLIARRDSANGKRFPILRQGKVIGAFGLDLSPLLARSQALIEQAAAHRAAEVELRGLKACILRLRQACLDRDLAPEAMTYVESLRNLLRRAGLTLAAAQDMLARLGSYLDPQPSAESAVLPADDGRFVRHKKTEDSKTEKTRLPDLWHRLSAIPAFFPDMPRSEHGLLQVLYDLGKMLRMDGPLMARAVAAWGLEKMLLLADRMAQHPERIASPNRYLARLLEVGRGQPA